MTSLTIDGQIAYNLIMLFVALLTFIFMYNKAIRNGADKADLTELRNYVDKQDRTLLNRINSIEKRLDNGIKDLQSDVKDILKILSKK